MKFGRVIATALSLALLASTPAISAVKAGATCKKIGTTKVSKGKTYTCIKSGKKLVWNKGVAIKKAAPVSSPTPTPAVTPSPAPTASPNPSQTPTPTPTPSPTPSYPEEPNSLSDIKSYDQITYWAWKKSSDKILRSDSTTNKVEILIGPNSGILNKNPLEATQITSRMFAGYKQPASLFFISYSFKDVKWAQEKLESLLADPELIRILHAGPNTTLATCRNEGACHSSQPFTNKRGSSIVIAGFTPSRLDNLEETKGQLQAHEFVHVLQQHQYLGTPNEFPGVVNMENAPRWLVEGGADFGGFIVSNYLSYDDYQKARMRDVLRSPKQTTDWFEKFINPSSFDYWIQFDSSGEIYNVGFMVTEIFAALKGPDSQMELFRLIANGKTMDEAFETIFGMPWKTAVPLIAKLISDERAKY